VDTLDEDDEELMLYGVGGGGGGGGLGGTQGDCGRKIGTGGPFANVVKLPWGPVGSPGEERI
jgi:hypothetical protein